MNIIIFCGGRGSTELIKGFSNYAVRNNQITLLINGYDDGKSTGRVRNFLNGVLGPSDFRKNISTILSCGDKYDLDLAYVLEYRVKNKSEFAKIMKQNFLNLASNLDYKRISFIKEGIDSFLNYEKKLKLKFDYNDCAIGNLLFAGYLVKHDFNLALEIICQSLIPNKNFKILNITNGENCYLNIFCNDDTYITDEAVIVENPEKKIYSEVFLTKDKITDQKKITSRDIFFPDINPEAKKEISKSDLIIYGPGTQFSSLIPSYLTKNITRYLNKSKAKKYLILNLKSDNDIYYEETLSLIDKIDKKLNFNSKYDNFDYIVFEDYANLDYNPDEKVTKEIGKKILKLPSSLDGIKHDHRLLVPNLINHYIASNKLNNVIHGNFISIIIPTLDEGDRLYKSIDRLLLYLNSHTVSYSYEILLVDGQCDEYLQRNIYKKYGNLVRYNKGALNRGESFATGIRHSRGDTIAFYPSDNEYDPSDLDVIISSLINSKYDGVIGNRSHNNQNSSKRIIQRGFFSYYGGFFATAFLYFFHKVFCSDVLSTLKAFKKNSLANIDFKCKKLDWDAELLIELTKNGGVIYELPINYISRTYKEGKKTTLINGLGMLYYIFKKKFF